jgi:hypothetical protein
VEQAAVVAWADANAKHEPALAKRFAIPNGAYLSGSKRTRAAQWERLKKAGARVGIPDLMFPAARQGYHGLLIEMKAARPARSSVSKDQKDRIAELRDEGYRCEVCRGADEAIDILCDYFGII